MIINTLTQSCSPATGVSSAPSGLGAFGSSGGAKRKKENKKK